MLFRSNSHVSKDLLIHDYLEYLRWGGFPQLKEIPDENERRRYITDVVVKKILRFDLPVRFSGENPMDLERLYEIYTTENGQLIEYENLLVYIVIGLLIRWKCPGFSKTFTQYPWFAVPYKRYTLPTIIDLCWQ